MRKISRPNVRIKSLYNRELELLNEPNYEKKIQSSHWRTPEVLGLLYSMHGRSCAYCQDKLTRGDRGDVEHFRPKDPAMYPWLAYSFSNYLLSCSKCNRYCKGKKFPLEKGAAKASLSENLEDEKRLLIDPVNDQVEDAFEIVFELNLAFVAINQVESNPVINRAKFTEGFFKFNTDPDLVKNRDKIITSALEAIDSDNIEEVRRLASRYSPHGIYVRDILKKNFPHIRLPTTEEELKWFLDHLIKSLNIFNRILQRNPEAPDTFRMVQIYCWTIHFLSMNPPCLSSEEIEKHIGAELLSEIRLVIKRG